MNGITDFPPTKLRRYPHMFALDIAIWERFLDRHASSWDGFSYDVKVGSGTEPTENLREPYRRMQEILSKYRIDIVGVRAGEIFIIEVKPDAGTIALGQLETYIPLYIRDHKPTTNVRGAIVTDRELPDVSELMDMKGHELYIV